MRETPKPVSYTHLDVYKRQLLSSEVAARYGLAAGDTLTVRHGVDLIDLTIAGLLAPSDDLSRRALDGLLATDIATAQEVLGLSLIHI